MRNHICAICGFRHVHNLHVAAVVVRYTEARLLNIVGNFRLVTADVVPSSRISAVQAQQHFEVPEFYQGLSCLQCGVLAFGNRGR
jgi:hypothetical protein